MDVALLLLIALTTISCPVAGVNEFELKLAEHEVEPPEANPLRLPQGVEVAVAVAVAVLVAVAVDVAVAVAVTVAVPVAVLVAVAVAVGVCADANDGRMSRIATIASA